MPPDQGVVSLVRPDGSVFDARAEDVGTLKTLGYQEESAESQGARLREKGQREHYTSLSQRAETGAEGLMSGMTLSVSDLLGLTSDREAQMRAQYNPGVRLASELTGSFALPLGRAAKAIEGGAEALGLGKVAAKGATGAVMGAGFGATGAITQAKLAGDPVTTEAILAGAGWGAVWGGGLSILAGKGEALLNSAAERAKRGSTDFASRVEDITERNAQERWQNSVRADLAVREGIQDYEKVVDGLGHRHYNEFRMSMQDAGARAKEAVDTVNAGVERANAASQGKFEEMEGLSKQNLAELKAGNNQINAWLTEDNTIKEVRPQARAANKAFSAAMKAAESGDYDKLASNLQKYSDVMGELETKYTKGPFGPQRLASTKLGDWLETARGAQRQAATQLAPQAAEEATRLASLQDTIGNLPKSTEDFVRMRSASVDKISAAMDTLTSLKSAEFTGVKNAVGDALDAWTQRLGLQIEGDGATLGSKFRAIHQELTDAVKAKTLDKAAQVADGERAFGSGMRQSTEAQAARDAAPKLGLAGRLTAKGIGLATEEAVAGGGSHNYMLRYGAYSMAKSAAASVLLALKGAVMGHITDITEKWAPRGAKAFAAAQRITPRIEPLARRLDGTWDKEKGTKQEMMQRRSEEIRSAAYGVRDTLYRSLSPLGTDHPDLASSMHELAAKQFAYILDQMPKDPGTAFNVFKSLWQPDSQACAKFEKCYEVFHDPVGALTRALESGKAAPETVEGIKEMYPQIYAEFRSDMFRRLSDPRVWNTMSYQEQINYGTLLGLPVHSTMRGHFIAAQQQMFTERAQLKPISPRPGMGTGGMGGRPPGGSSGTARMSSSQRITLH